METFRKLFASLLVFVYHCFDRVVIQGYLPLLTRPEHIVHFFRDVHGVSPLTKEVGQTDAGIPAMGRGVRSQPPYSDRVAGRRGLEDQEAQKGRLRPALRTAHGAAE